METTELSIIEKRELLKESLNFAEQFDKLEKAIKQTQNVQKLAKEFEDKGFWSTVTGTLNGKSDKTLAESIKTLGASVEVTQEILNIILRISECKNNLLRDFHLAITNKIIELENNTSSIDDNQKNSNQATLIIAKKMKIQIEEKIAHQEKILEHDSVISELKKISKQKDELDEQQSQELEKLKLINFQKNEIDEKQSMELEQLKLLSRRKDQIDEFQSKELNELKKELHRLNNEILKIKGSNHSKFNSIIGILAFITATSAFIYNIIG